MILLENARLIDPEALTERRGSVLVANGRIAGDPRRRRASGRRPRPPPRRIDAGGLCLAPGIVDIGVKVCEPGERHKESFRSAGEAALAGGVTTMVTRPDTDPGDRHARGAGVRHPPGPRGGAGQHPPHGGADQGPAGPRDDRDRVPARRRRRRLHRLRPGGHRHQGADPRDDLCPLARRARHRPSAGAGPERSAPPPPPASSPR